MRRRASLQGAERITENSEVSDAVRCCQRFRERGKRPVHVIHNPILMDGRNPDEQTYDCTRYANRKPSAQPEDAKRKRLSAQPEDAKRKRLSAQPEDAKRKRLSAQPEETSR